ncbi:retrotransposon protein, putative, unclassified [Tanacetum coccineum]
MSSFLAKATCRCGLPLRVLTSWTPTNPSRSFAVCAIILVASLLHRDLLDHLGFCGSGTFSQTLVELDQLGFYQLHAWYGMWFFESKREWGGRGVKEKNKDSDNVATKDVVVPPVVDEPVVAISGNSSGTQDGNVVSSTATSVEGRKSVNFRTLITPMGNGTDVAVPLESIRAISKRLNNTAYGFFLGKRVAYPVVANYFSSMDGLDSMLENRPWFIRNNPLILKKWDPDVNLLKEDVVNVPVWVKVHDVHVTAFSKDGLSAIATKLECPKNIDVGVEKNLKKPSQPSRGVPVGPKVGFKTTKQVLELFLKSLIPTLVVIRKKDAECRKEVSNSNPFDVLNSIENDVDLGTNEETSNLDSKEANSSGSSFWNVGSSSISTTPIVKKIDKLENLIIDEKITLVDDEGKPLKKADYPNDHDSEDEGASVDNEITSFLASERVGFGYVPDNMQSICDNLDIKLRGRKKK